MISKRGGGGCNYEFIIDDAPSVLFYYLSVTRLLAVDWRGARTIAVNISHGAVPDVYIDGLLAGPMNGTSNVVAKSVPLFVGNWYQFTRSTLNPVQAALVFNRQLTATEHAALHGELMAMPGGEH